MQRLKSVADDALLRELHVIVRSHRRVTAELILHLSEVDFRRLHVEKGFSSLFGYCVERLAFSEDEACRRIEAARLLRRFPTIYALLEAGSISLTVLSLLKPHLNEANHRELLAGVSGMSVRQGKEWVAARFPRPDVPWSIRKRPEPRAIDQASVATRLMTDISPAPARLMTDISLAPARHASDASPVAARIAADPPLLATRSGSDASAVAARIADRARVEPLSQDRFLVKFTANRAMTEKLDLARDLMLHANPTGELAVVLERALDLLIAELEKKKQGRTGRMEPGPAVDRTADRRERTHITVAARREVVALGGWRCSFVSKDGRRCDARGFLEFDHETPKGRGGSSEAQNLRLLCRAHNRWAAECVYGKAHVARAIRRNRQ